MRSSAAFVALVLAGSAGCDAGTTKLIGTDFCAGAPSAPPTTLGLDASYTQYMDGNGIPVLASSAVDDQAVIAACKIVVRMVKKRDDVRRALIRQRQRVAIIGVNQVTTDIPEYKNLYAMFPNQDWDRLRGIGATLLIPVSSVGEENLLCLADDPFAGEQILVQTFATAVLLGVDEADDTFDSRLSAAYDAATSAGLWKNTYAGANVIEYYAEGVQSWFDANLGVAQPDGNNGPINTRGELKVYDPALADLIAETMTDDKLPASCQ